ncbi:receptor-like cytosolic serine/threonine-protein kinase RBK1 [Andrographis paniculata]|uniref:receptor-like cytosolic serine/threonine-protein kinase RBK1 n=1 Tax=Andrographis paniculata TaxID=175694 RepID=UPI0021E787CA|nr:receptor-like cytosolic serine/threonine-protein kinase RBK1 [Andrographis paniculata]
MTMEEIDGNQAQTLQENAANQDRGETPKLNDASESKHLETEDDESSPCGVLERPASGSDSDHSIDSSGSFGSGDKSHSPWDINYGSMQLRKFIGQLKKMPSSTRFATIPLIGGSVSDLSIRSLRKKLGRNHSSEESINAGDFVVPKPSWRSFTHEELKKATDNFSSDNLIGKGGHAEVYKGFLADGQPVAVKKIMKEEQSDEDRISGFLTELGIIAHIHHQNCVKLVGFSADGGLHLVLEFCPYGSLDSALHGSENYMEWKMRYKVALGVAEGLKYLHFDCQRRVVHRDITASNILLAEDYEPQISDFGLAKWLPEKWSQHVVSPIEGTFGYMAPEYFMHGIVNEKIDVFAFGVLLLELITGCRSVDSRRQSLVMWAKPLLEHNDMKEMVDARLGDNYDTVEMKRAMFAASMCIHHSPNLRPSMTRVIQVLKGETKLGGDLKQKSLGMRSLLWDNCDLEDYTSATYLNDLNRHKQLILE